MTEFIKTYLERSQHALDGLPLDVIEEVVALLFGAWRDGRQVFLMGNGGSSATASHFANDLNKTAIISGQRRFKALALTDNVPLITAWANDEGYEEIFSQQMLNFVNSGDIVIAMSGSGDSANIIAALRLARAVGARTIGVSGLTGGKMRALVDYFIGVPSDEIMQIEGVHGVLMHAIIARFRQVLTEEIAENKTRIEVRSNRPAIFLDRDGVINANRSDYVKSWDEFVFLPGALSAIRSLSDSKYAIVIVSNQSAIGRGLMSQAAVDNINNRMVDMIYALGGRVDGIYYCPHRPDEECDCRKPRPGLFLKAAQNLDLDLGRSIVVGDAVSDIEAGVGVGCRPIFVLPGRGPEELAKFKANGYDSIIVVKELAQVVELLPEIGGIDPLPISESRKMDLIDSLQQ